MCQSDSLNLREEKQYNGFCWSSGKLINSSTLKVPEPSRSNFLKRRARRRNSYPSKLELNLKNPEMYH